MALELNANRRIGLALLWLALLAVAGFWLSETLKVTGDLRKFMPAPRTPAQKLLIEELGEGPGSRLLLMALSNSDPVTLAEQSQQLQKALAAQPELFELVGNGGNAGLEAIPKRLLPYRYLLSDSSTRLRWMRPRWKRRCRRACRIWARRRQHGGAVAAARPHDGNPASGRNPAAGSDAADAQ